MTTNLQHDDSLVRVHYAPCFLCEKKAKAHVGSSFWNPYWDSHVSVRPCSSTNSDRLAIRADCAARAMSRGAPTATATYLPRLSTTWFLRRTRFFLGDIINP